MSLPKLRGYEYLGKKNKERYRAPDGSIISKREYRNRQVKRAGLGKSLSDLEYRTQPWAGKRSHKAAVSQKQRDLRIRQASQTQKIPERELRRWDSEYERLLKPWRDSGHSTDAEGPGHDFLVYLGLRDPEADYDIGGTP